MANIDMENQIWDIQDNLILKRDGSVFAVYEIPSKIINSVDDEAKEEFKTLVYSVLSDLQKYHDFDIRMIPIDQDLFSRFEKLALDIDWENGGGELAEYILSQMIIGLENSIGVLYDYKYYLTVPLKSIHVSVDLKSVVEQSYRKVVSGVLATVGIAEDVSENWKEKYQVQKEVLENTLSLLDARPISREENIFINRLQFLRGQFYDKEYEVELVKNSIDNLDEANIEFEQVNVMKLTNMTESSYVAFLPINTVPQNVSYLHLQEELQTLRFPVETVFKCQFSIGKGAFSLLGKSGRARDRMKNVMDEADQADSMQKGSVIRSKYLLEDLQQKIDDGEALLSYLQTLVITGDSIEELKNKFEVLYAHLNQLGVELVRANADQVYLFYKNRLGELLNQFDKNFIQSMSMEAFCENLFFMTRKVGTDVGFAIGRVDNQTSSWQGDYQSAIASSSNPVYTNLFQANKLGVQGKSTNNPHTAIIGETGTGKSFLTKLLFTYHSLLKGKSLYIDPKAEMRRQYLKVLSDLKEKGEFPELQSYIESIEFVTLDAKNPDNYGVLDPIVFLEGQEAVDLADSMIDSLLGKDNNPTVQAGYLEAIDTILTRRQSGEKVGMMHVFEEMEKSSVKEVEVAGTLLKRIVKNSILSLCFSDGRNEAVSLENKTTILEIAGLDLPKDANDNQKLTKSQQKSLTVMYALGYFCKRFGERDKTEETVIYLDEAWFFNSTAVGRAILMALKRVGRSFNNFMVLITQSVKDLDTTDDSTGFGTVFAFKEKTEVDEVLDYLKVHKTKKTRDWYNNMTMGQCIYYDTFGRRERITVDGMFPEITVLFDTVETKLQAA